MDQKIKNKSLSVNPPHPVTKKKQEKTLSRFTLVPWQRLLQGILGLLPQLDRPLISVQLFESWSRFTLNFWELSAGDFSLNVGRSLQRRVKNDDVQDVLICEHFLCIRLLGERGALGQIKRLIRGGG